LADNIYKQLEKYFLTFRAREAYLLRECELCVCEACKRVGELKLKAILHLGNAAFTKVHDIQKISGEDVITVHRLLKNSISSDEYVLATNSFLHRVSDSFDTTDFEKHVEHCDGVGPVHGMVRSFESVETVPAMVPRWKKFMFLMKIERHMLARLFGKAKLQFRNLPLED
jgi:hypothetical protein